MTLGQQAHYLVLGYWRLINMGILHRDISEGNVMMLRPGQTFTRREWKEEQAVTHEIQDEVLAESEKKLREVLSKLDRDPTGMLSDFDLHTIHSSAASKLAPTQEPTPTDGNHQVGSGQPSPSMPSPESQGTVCWNAKKRKTNCYGSVPVQSAQPQASADQQREGATEDTRAHTPLMRGTHRLIDFRTVITCSCSQSYCCFLVLIRFQGTPAFMSSRVLRVLPGVKYRHTFLDDLESFFWVIFHSAAAHLDSRDAIPTDAAQGTINELDRWDLTNLGSWKSGTLTFCLKQCGAEMRGKLKSFGNAWASDPIFVNTIVRFGAYLEHISMVDDGDPSKFPPATVFSTIVDIILSQLK
jgi:hypothetical protein